MERLKTVETQAPASSASDLKNSDPQLANFPFREKMPVMSSRSSAEPDDLWVKIINGTAELPTYQSPYPYLLTDQKPFDAYFPKDVRKSYNEFTKEHIDKNLDNRHFLTPAHDPWLPEDLAGFSTDNMWEHGSPLAKFKGFMEYDSQATPEREPGRRFDIETGWRFGSRNQYSIYADVRYEKRFIGKEELETLWTEDDSLALAGGGNAANVDVLEEFSVKREERERERIRSLVNWDWRPNEETHLYLRTVYKDYRDKDDRHELEYDTAANLNEAVYLPANAANIQNGVLTSGTSNPTDGRIERKIRQKNETERTLGFMAGLEHELPEDLKFSGFFSYVREDKDDDDTFKPQYRLFSNAASNPAGILAANSSLFAYNVNGSDAPVITNNPDGLTDNNNAANFHLNKVETEDVNVDQEHYNFQIDVEKYYDLFEHESRFKVGTKFSRQTYIEDITYNRYDVVGARLNSAPLLSGAADNSVGTVNGFVFGPGVNGDAARSQFENALASGVIARSSLESSFRSAIEDQDHARNIYSAYFMNDVTVGDFMLTLGLRVEQAFEDTKSQDAQWNGAEAAGGGLLSITTRRNNRTEVHLLPGAQVAYQPLENVKATFGYQQTLVRPDLNQSAPYSRVERWAIEAPGGAVSPIFIGESGNTDLKTTLVHNLDLGVDFKHKASSYFHLGGFFQVYQDNIYNRVNFSPTFAGSRIGSTGSPLLNKTADNGDAHAFGFNVRGIQRADILEEWFDLPAGMYGFDGFGVFASYTYTKSEQDIDGINAAFNPISRKIDMVNRPEHQVVAGAFYEKYGFYFQLAMIYTDTYLAAQGGSPDGTGGALPDWTNYYGDIYRDKFIRLDLAASYAFNDHFEVFGEIRNLTNESSTFLEGEDEKRFLADVDEGMLYRIGMELKW